MVDRQNNERAVVALRLDREASGGHIVNDIVSAYGKDKPSIENWMAWDLLRYVNKQARRESARWLQLPGDSSLRAHQVLTEKDFSAEQLGAIVDDAPAPGQAQSARTMFSFSKGGRAQELAREEAAQGIYGISNARIDELRRIENLDELVRAPGRERWIDNSLSAVSGYDPQQVLRRVGEINDDAAAGRKVRGFDAKEYAAVEVLRTDLHARLAEAEAALDIARERGAGEEAIHAAEERVSRLSDEKIDVVTEKVYTISDNEKGKTGACPPILRV